MEAPDPACGYGPEHECIERLPGRLGIADGVNRWASARL